MIMLHYNKGLKQLSRNLRKSMTDAERLFWSRIRGKQLKGLQFYRQKIIGNYIADFYCPRARLVVEIDGGQHNGIEGRKKDSLRDEYMARAGLTALRFTDREVLQNLEEVLERLWVIC